MNPWGAPGTWTSGRRTYRGNRLVGGVPNSDHLTGHAADFAGTSMGALRAHFGPNVRLLDEKDHIHVSGLNNVPYHGNRGIAGLVNGVDTSAPKGQPPVRRPDPITRRLMPNYLQMSMPQGGVDPLAPQQPPQQELPNFSGQTTDPQIEMNAQPNYAAMSQPSMGRDPLAPKPKAFGKGGIGWAILGSLGDALSAYGGQKGVFAPAMQDMMSRQAQEDQFREKLAMEHQYRMAELQARSSAPPKQSQTERMAAAVLDPRTPDAQRRLYMQILTKPMVSFGADGSATSGYDYPTADSGDDDEWSYN